jgi:TNF receptor-associated protein 1
MEAMGQPALEMKARLEINPRHELVKQLNRLRGGDEELAGAVARQLADNALLAAGLGTSEADAAANMNGLLSRLLGELGK